MSEVALFNGDCLEFMPALQSKSIDMICCDLPYEVTQNKADIRIPFEPLWKEYERLIKDNGCIALFGQGIFYVDLVQSNRKLFKYDLIWDKVLVTGFLNAKRMPLRRHEQIAIFYKKLPIYNPQFVTGKPSHDKGTLHKTKDVINNNYGSYVSVDNRKDSTDKYPTSILKFAKPHPSIAKHRTEKSIECLEWLIKSYTNEGDTVLDNCMGAGSCGIAAVRNNRNFIGMELDRDYFDIARERINDEKRIV